MKYEVEAIHTVEAKDADDAVRKLRTWLDKQTVELADGVRSYIIPDDAVYGVLPDGREIV